MTLKTFYGKSVDVICTDGQTFSGVVDDYFFPEDNDNNKESIVLKTHDFEFVELTSEEIEKIDIK